MVCVNRNRRCIDEKNVVERRTISWINKSNTAQVEAGVMKIIMPK